MSDWPTPILSQPKRDAGVLRRWQEMKTQEKEVTEKKHWLVGTKKFTKEQWKPLKRRIIELVKAGHKREEACQMLQQEGFKRPDGGTIETAHYGNYLTKINKKRKTRIKKTPKHLIKPTAPTPGADPGRNLPDWLKQAITDTNLNGESLAAIVTAWAKSL